MSQSSSQQPATPATSIPPQAFQQQLDRLHTELSHLQQTVRLMEEQRQHLLDQRRRRTLIIGSSLSILFHLALLIYLGVVYRTTGGGAEAAGINYNVAILNEEELSFDDPGSFDQLETEAITTENATLETAVLTAVQPSTTDFSVSAGSVATLGGAGGGNLGEGGLGGGSGTTSFHGIGAKGTRFAFIIDVSGSMGEFNKFPITMRELVKAVQQLPDNCSFFVLFFSDRYIEPPMQNGWMKARKPLVRQFIAWLDYVGPSGGTSPRSSFEKVFSLSDPPDAVYFLTDGIFQDITADEIIELNRKNRRRAVIHTIQFGDEGSEDLLRQVAKATGGMYRFVPAVVGP